MQNNEKNVSTGAKLFGLIFVLWFIASLGGLFYITTLDEQPTDLILIIIGQFFTVFGILAMASNKPGKDFPFILFMFPIVGLSLLSVGLLLKFGGPSMEAMIEQYAPAFVILVFPAAGVIMVVQGIILASSYNRRIRECNTTIQAKCTDVKMTRMSRHGTHIGYNRTKVYMPVFTIYYNNKTYTLKNNMYSNHIQYEKGMYYDIKINPKNPLEFINGNEITMHKMLIGLGIVCIIVGCAAFALILNII